MQTKLTVQAVRALFKSSDDATRLQQAYEMFVATTADEAKEVLRGKDKAKGEQYAPLVVEFMATDEQGKPGMALASARNRHSEFKALYWGYLNKVDILGAGGITAAIATCRKEMDKASAAKKAESEHQAKSLVAYKALSNAPEGADPADILAAVDVTFSEQQAEKEANATFTSLVKKANKLGYIVLPQVGFAESIMAIRDNDGVKDLVTQLQTLVANREAKQQAEQAEQQAQAESNKAHIMHEVEAHKAPIEVQAVVAA